MLGLAHLRSGHCYGTTRTTRNQEAATNLVADPSAGLAAAFIAREVARVALVPGLVRAQTQKRRVNWEAQMATAGQVGYLRSVVWTGDGVGAHIRRDRLLHARVYGLDW